MVKLEHTQEDLNAIMKALGKLPFEEVYRVISNINAQLANLKKEDGNQ